MENQHNKGISKELLEYRDQINQIDYKIIDLLGERMRIVDKVGKHKKERGDKFFIRSNREADMIKGLIERSKIVNQSVPPSVIVTIWRKIITSANVLEQNIKIGVHNPKNSLNYNSLLKDYYGDFVPMFSYTDALEVISKIKKNDVQIGVFALSSNGYEDDCWWIKMAGNVDGLKVFANIPFVRKSDDRVFEGIFDDENLVGVTIKDAERSSSDKSLFVVEVLNGSSDDKLQQMLRGSGFEYKIIKRIIANKGSENVFYLIEIDGFFVQGDEKVLECFKDHGGFLVNVIGNYPTPVII